MTTPLPRPLHLSSVQTAPHHCSLLLVDRTLDLTGPTLHHADSLADRILTLLPHTSPCSNDVAVDMTALHSSHVGVAGSLAQSQLKAKQLLRTLITSKQKVGGARVWLMRSSTCTCACACDRPPPSPGFPDGSFTVSVGQSFTRRSFCEAVRKVRSALSCTAQDLHSPVQVSTELCRLPKLM